MENVNIKNNFTEESNNSNEKNIFVLTLALVFIALFVLGVQILPYFYKGVPGHYHNPQEQCGWPYGNCKI